VQDVHFTLKYMNAIVKAAFNKKRIFFTSKLDFNEGSTVMIHLERSFVWC